MSSLALLVTAAACAITGAALFATRGVLDQTVTSNGVLRFALLPPWQALVGFVCLAALVVVAIDHLNAPKGSTTFRRPGLADLVLPLFALVVLLFPFLPWIPDRWPVVQALSGPLSVLVWISVGGMLLWTLWQHRLIDAGWIAGWSLGRVAAAIGIATVVLAGAASARLTGTPLFPAGDEPHYLVMAQSVWRDGDLKIENNHAGRDYAEYYAPELEPHYLTRGSDEAIYSIHPVGLPLLMAPVYGAGGYQGVVWTLILIAASAAALAWWWTMRSINAAGPATFAWAAIVGSAPFLFNTFTVYPEIPAALAVMIALYCATTGGPLSRWLAVGVACAALPWLSTKYAPMSAALVLVACGRLWTNDLASFFRNSKVWAVTAPYALSLAGWFAFFYAIWGVPSPTAPYGSLTQTTPLNLTFGAPGLLFDQEYGLLAFAPVYILAATGLVHMWRGGGALRRQAVEIAIVFGALLGTVGAFRIWWGGTSAPARPLASGLLLLALPIAIAFRSAAAGSARRAAHHLLLWISIAIAGTLALAQHGLLIDNGRDGTSALLEYWSPRWELFTLAPTFIYHPAMTAWGHTLLWLAVAAAAAAILARTRAGRPGIAALTAIATLTGALAIVAVTFPLLPANPPWPTIDLEARARLAALDGFDSRVRPSAVLYSPLRRVAATEVIPQLTLGVKPQQRVDRQPLRVIHNGRFSLPAGHYTIAVAFGDQVPTEPSPLAVQVGRVGAPLQTWTLEPRPGEEWRTSLDLALDAGFVGLRGSADLERAIRSIRITPTSVVDAGVRPHVPPVLAAAAYPGATLYFHDEKMYPEPAGFWTIGGQSAQVTVVVPPDRTDAPVLRIHSGATPNTVTISTFGWERSFSLTPGQAQTVELPVFAGGVIPLRFATAQGFSPRDIDPNSKDERFLGIWVELDK